MAAGNGMNDLVVMTPVRQGPTENVIRVDRYSSFVERSKLPNDVLHIAGGQHTGIIIRKQPIEAEPDCFGQEISDLQMEFTVYLVDANSGNHKMENRQLRFWFKEGTPQNEKHYVAQEFFKSFLQQFPKDYVGLIKRVLKLMQHGFPLLRKIELDLRLVEEATTAPTTKDYTESGEEVESVTVGHVQEVLEHAYPNGLSLEIIATALRCSVEEVLLFLEELKEKDVVKELESGEWIRHEASQAMETAIVKQMPKVGRTDQPTVAIITALFVEKLAVDAMIENKQTFVRYKTDGESNIYTLGNIGQHRVVATKLSAIGHTRAAMIAAGSITTRLLGGFQNVEHVLVVGVGGGVPHYTDKTRHVRLGDVVVSGPYSEKENFAYVYCDKIERNRDTGEAQGYAVKTWNQRETTIPEICESLFQSQSVRENGTVNGTETDEADWLTELGSYAEEAQKSVGSATASSEYSFERPAANTDVLTLPLGGGDVATVSHPADDRKEPRVHLGPIGAGRAVLRDPALRAEFAHRFHLRAYDADFDSVVESIYGNRIDSWGLIRGIADYGDGMRNKEWQAYSALQAAAVAKLLIQRLPLN